MTKHEFDTMTTTVSDGDHPQQRGQKLVDRQAWLTGQGAHGWELVSTITLPGDGLTVIVDTMTRQTE
jgi:hypothetical protein